MAARERRPSKQSEWDQMRKGLTGELSKRGFEEREKVPDKACGKCSNYSEIPFSTDGRGNCMLLRIGSDILSTPPVVVLEGDSSYVTVFNVDASNCPHYTKMEFIDTDTSECADPQFKRSQRQFKE